MSMNTKIRYSYLKDQFQNIDPILESIRSLVHSGDFTLGKELTRFESSFAELINVKHAFGVASGTDAIKLSLKALGIGVGDEVITAANTFIATVGAIVETGAIPRFIDCNDQFCMNVEQINHAITDKTRAIVPVHFTGYMTEMDKIMSIAHRYNLVVVEDACQAILATDNHRLAGSIGHLGAFSLHPLKNLNVWGDGGVITTNDDKLAEKIKLLRNHGLKNRDEIVLMGYNSRLDTLQAVVGNHLINDAISHMKARIERAGYYDQAFAQIPGIQVPDRIKSQRQVYHLYIVFAEDRDNLYKHCLEQGVEAKIHYPIPLYAQEGLKQFGYKLGDFPTTDRHAKTVISFPCDPYINTKEQDYVVDVVRSFYARS